MSDTTIQGGAVNAPDKQSDFAELEDFSALDARARGALLCSIIVVALCGIVYELIIGSVSSYLLGDSVTQFSITIGFFMFAMGIGSFVSQFIRRRLIETFILVEIALAIIGGLCSIGLFLAFPFAPTLYQTIMLSFILAIGALVGLEIPLLTRILAQGGGTRKSIANVMSLDYVGALVGSVAFPLLLLPNLGLVRASFAIGIANVFVALATIYFVRTRLPAAPRLAAMAAAVLAALIVLMLAGSRLSGFAQHHLYFDDVIWSKQSQYQSLIITRDRRKSDLRLFIDGHLQFAQSDEHRYHEALVHPVMSHPGARASVLVLGGGDGLAVRELLKYDDVAHIDLVDLDPEMTRLGSSFAPLVALNDNALADPRVHVHNQDAFVFIRQTDRRYDRVIIDMPDPHDAVLSKLYAVEFYEMIRRSLSPDGVVVTQASSPFFARRTFWSIGATMDAVFADTAAYNISIPSFGVWGFHLAAATPNRLAVEPAINVATRYWSEELMPSAKVFPADIGPTAEATVNSIFEPTLFRLYQEDMRQRLKS
ncbi:MAG: polyamine aminopropyltransferase [Pseudomonadota bacterium]